MAKRGQSPAPRQKVAQIEKTGKKLFFDANQLFTAAWNPEGLAAGVIRRHKKLKLILITSAYTVEEARYNIGLKAPAPAQDELEKILRWFDVIDVGVREDFNPLHLPPDDLPVFQGALASKATHLITGDKKAFGSWFNRPEKTFGLVIQTLRMFVDEMEK